jgi:hypothetical protein
MATAARGLSLVTALRAAPVQFLLQEEQVDHGDSNGSHGEARGGLCQRRRPESMWLGFRNWGKCEAEEEENELGFIVGLLYFAGARLVTKPSSGRLPARGRR